MLKQCCVYDLGRSKIPKKLCYRSTEIKLVFWALFYSGLEPLVVAVSGYLLLELADGRHERNVLCTVFPTPPPIPSMQLLSTNSAFISRGTITFTVSRLVSYFHQWKKKRQIKWFCVAFHKKHHLKKIYIAIKVVKITIFLFQIYLLKNTLSVYIFIISFLYN